MRSDGRTGDTGTVSAAVEVLEGRSARRGLARILPFLGPAFVASVAYIDPGNFATNIQGGAQFGYLLLWVIVASNLTAMLVQALSAKLGIATGRNLAEVCRDQFSRPVVWGMWVINELVAMATDLAEFLGAALGFYLLLRIPLLLAAFLTGILGATVMPHVIFLHSALTQRRIVPRDEAQARRLFRFEVTDVVIAMGLAGLVNAAMLIMAASTFYTRGLTGIASIEEAHRTLAPLLGSASSVVFAVSLLASGLSSSTVGTMAGQVIMQGFLHRQTPILLRRVVTRAPAIVVIAMGLDPTRTLVISQVILSFGLPFALVPLVLFTSRRTLMGGLVNRAGTTALAAAATAVIIALNLFLLYRIAMGG